MNPKIWVAIVSAGILALQLALGASPAGKVGPKSEGTANDPLIQLELPPLAADGGAEALLALLNQIPGASRTAVLPRYPGAIAKDRFHPQATAVVAIGERQWADISDLDNRLCKSGFPVSAIYLSDFGTVRIHTRFGPFSGETIEVTEGNNKRLVLAPTNPARQAIEAAFHECLADAHYTEAGTKPNFNLAPDKPELRIAFHLRANQAIDIGILLAALDRAGCRPLSMRVARMGAGVSFGFPIPGDVKLVDSDGVPRMSGRLQKPGRPMVLVFFPLQAKFKKAKEEHTYQAEPGHFALLKEMAQKYANRADFFGISGRKEDAFADATALWRKADMSFPVLHDPAQKLATALSAGLMHAPPHIFIADAEGRLRYAGDFADGWIQPEKIKRLYLAEALDRVLAKKYADNGAVFYNSPLCDCSAPACGCPKCGCGGPCRCGCSTGGG
jgi:hypothetical protein